MHDRGLNTKTIGPEIHYYKNSWGVLNELPHIMQNKTKIERKQGD